MNQPPREPPRRRPPQMTLGFMMLMMVIFAVMSAGLFYASRVPVVQEEISLLFRGQADHRGQDVGRAAQITFILFTFSSPLLLAAVLSSTLAFWRWIEARR